MPDSQQLSEADIKAVLNSVRMNVENALTSRSSLMRKLADTRRDINAECGYPDTSRMDASLFREYFDRWSFAARAVSVIPLESWKLQPIVYETEDPEEKTDFEQSLDDITSRLTSIGGELSHYRIGADGGNPLWSTLKTADILSGIGHYGGLFLGLELKNGERLDKAPNGNTNVLEFIRPLDETSMQISSLNNDPGDPRFGLPQMYNVTFDDVSSASATVTTMRTQMVHHSRIIHLADNRMGSAVIGVPRMRPVFNHILNLEKVYGGSGEMYWRGAFPGVTFETDPRVAGEMNLDTDTEEGAARIQAIKDMIEQMMNGLQRYALFDAITMKTHSPVVVSPNEQIDAEIMAICIQLGIPKRIFVGSERGELASSQDDTTWNTRMMERATQYVAPFVVAPTLNRLLALGVLAPPAEGYGIYAKDMTSSSASDQAEISLKRTQALAAYVAGDVMDLMEPIDYLTRELGYTIEEANDILERKMEAIDQENEDLARDQPQPQDDDPDNVDFGDADGS